MKVPSLEVRTENRTITSTIRASFQDFCTELFTEKLEMSSESACVTTDSPEEERLTIPRGGPLYLSNLEGEITSVEKFQSSVINVLCELAELCSYGESCSSTDCEDISIEELMVYTDEELVDMAMKEAFKEGEVAENSFQPLEQQHILGYQDHRTQSSENGTDKDKTALVVSGSGSPSVIGRNRTTLKRNSKRRKRNRREVNGAYIERVEQLTRIKQKQDEAKAATNLHSLRTEESANVATDRTEVMKTLRSISSAIKVKSPINNGHLTVQYPEVILSVEIYHNKKASLKTQEFLVLGRQTLTELRDNIYCITDQVMQKAGEHDPSGYFLIEDVFYNDLRDPYAINYSEPIFDWLTNSKDEVRKKWKCITTGELKGKQKAVIDNAEAPQLPQFKAAEMDKTRFCDLWFRLGAGYLYCHQGDCKHTIVIRDMRLIHPEDVHKRAAYPLTTFQLKSRAQKCYVCKIYRAKMVTVDDKWALENPCYFCENCYYLLHYNDDGSLLYNDFSVYEYLPDH